MNDPRFVILATRHVGVRDLVSFFSYEHLPEKLKSVSKPFHDLAFELLTMLPDSAELTAGLRKLLEAKDCAVRAAVRSDGEILPKGK